MAIYRKMLIAIEGHQPGFHALKEALRLADLQHSWACVLCVTPPYVGDLETVAIDGIRQAMAKPCADSEKVVAQISEETCHPIKFLHAEGPPHERIIEMAEEYNCDLIVMGKHAANNLERSIIGSVAAQVVGRSTRDVLIVPEDVTIKWDNILVATDGSECSEKAVQRAIDFASSYQCSMTALSVADIPEEAHAVAPDFVELQEEKARSIAEEAADKAMKSGIKAHARAKSGDSTHNSILEAAEELSAGITFLSSHGKTGLKRLLLGSVAEKVITLSSGPVLVAK